MPPPSVLFCVPRTSAIPTSFVSWDYMRSLRKSQSIEVDFTSSLEELNPARMQNYSALVLFRSPAAALAKSQDDAHGAIDPALAAGFSASLRKYVEGGGGVLFMPSEDNWRQQELYDVLPGFGATLPLERLNESNASNVAAMRHMPTQTLYYTDAVTRGHPLTSGVRGVWYPASPHYNAADTNPLMLDSNWTALVHAAPTACTSAIDLTQPKYFPLPPNVTQRSAPVCEPPLLAVRNVSRGRVALLSQYRQYTLGSGDGWLFDSQVLSSGSGGRPSGMGALLESLLRWLAAPQPGGPGGYVAPPDRLVPPNDSPAERAKFAPQPTTYNASALEGHDPAEASLRTLRGVIGARTVLTSGTSTVADYADAARKAGLDFVVLLEEWAVAGRRAVNASTIASLTAACAAHSSDQLQLLPGFTIRTNFGNEMFVFGPKVPLPADEALSADELQLQLAAVDPSQPHNFTGYNNNAAFSYLLSFANAGTKGVTTAGYYHLGPSRASGALRMADLRLYSMVAIKYYGADGTLIEDLSDEYLLTAEGTLAPTPCVLSDVRSAAGLLRAAQAQALTYARAPNASAVFSAALRWNNQYDGPHVFISDGPTIERWSATSRVYSLGARRFDLGNAQLIAPISVSSTAPLVEVNISNGRRLFRRFVPAAGSTHLFRTLLLDGYVHKNLVLTAADSLGRRAISFPLRTWKPGLRSVVFCADHVNDCQSGFLLSRGPVSPTAAWVNPLPDDIAGHTWDGAPPAKLPLLLFEETRPSVLGSALGSEDGGRFTQTPHLEYTDEHSAAVASRQDRLIADSVTRVVNPWHTFGPIGGPSRLINFTLSYREFFPPTVGVPESSYAGLAVHRGMVATIFRSTTSFRIANSDVRLQLLRSASSSCPVRELHALVREDAGGPLQDVTVSELGNQTRSFRLAAGGMLGLYAPAEPANAQIYFNRRAAVDLTLRQCGGGPAGCQADWAVVSAAGSLTVGAGQVVDMELAQLGFSLEQQLNSSDALMAAASYVGAPAGLRILRGARRADAAASGLLEVQVDSAGGTSVVAPRHPSDEQMMLPLRVHGLNPSWSAALLQYAGWHAIGAPGGNGGVAARREGAPTAGAPRFSSLGVDGAGSTSVGLYTGLSDVNVTVCHPVVAIDAAGATLRIEATLVFSDAASGAGHSQLNSSGAGQHPAGYRWHVALNNPTHAPITTRVRAGVSLPDLVAALPTDALTIGAGEWRVLSAV